MRCNNCGAELQDNAKFCTSCGASVESTSPQGGSKHCPNCGSPLAGDASFCTNCGQRVGGPARQGAPRNNYIRPRKNQADLKKLGLIIGGSLLALLLLIFVIVPLFNTGLSEKKATKMVENTINSIMDFDFEKASKNFANVSDDDYRDFVDEYQSMQSELGGLLGNNTLADFMDIKITPMAFTCNKSAGTAQGTYNVVFSLNKKGIKNPTINGLLNMALSSGGPQKLEVEFVKVGRKWKISDLSD